MHAHHTVAPRKEAKKKDKKVTKIQLTHSFLALALSLLGPSDLPIHRRVFRLRGRAPQSSSPSFATGVLVMDVLDRAKPVISGAKGRGGYF